ncbi:type II secretion system protein N [Algimonas arctica]|nr:type II secretion system protein N [Algimonas arctica]
MTIKSAPTLLWMRRGLLAAFTILAVWLLVRLILALSAPSSLWTPVLVAGPAPVSAVATRTYDFTYNPFAAGDSVGETVVSVDTGDDAPETTLNLQLKGLRSGENGTAFIRTPDGQEDNVYIGEEIMPGVFLRGVFPSHALIDVNGQTQRLTTEDAKAARNRASSSQSAASSPRSGLQTIRSADATALLSQIQIIPSFDLDMTRNGVMVKPRTSAVDLSAFGLRDGDIITRFAGQSVVSGLPDIGALRRSAGSGQPVTVDLIRDGQTMTITIGSSS